MNSAAFANYRAFSVLKFRPVLKVFSRVYRIVWERGMMGEYLLLFLVSAEFF